MNAHPASTISILFLCTGNSCRSQMAEGLCRHFKGNQITAASAGVELHGLNPLAVQVMSELNIDISSQQSKTTDQLPHKPFDYVITVCDHAHESCPIFPAQTRVIHRGFDDPPHLARNAASADEALSHYRRVRDEIRDYILTLPAALSKD
ncbi:MAG: arsenate reductase ArsC [Desulfobulbaceae bacterium]|uniref:Arsenate reductase ArsC n=1 Tax=Candidatus Desulfatifera sulfidica TaxID=2841691 RepID=A0A8J6NAL8_9BACT|nr:arsenate reductase ArsC [Candidatus Desulfatifera sulfidica]